MSKTRITPSALPIRPAYNQFSDKQTNFVIDHRLKRRNGIAVRFPILLVAEIYHQAVAMMHRL